MVKYSDVKNFLITTDANSSKNLSTATYNFAFTSVSVPAGSYVLRSYTVPLSTLTRLYQIYVNLSIDGDFWTAMPCRDRTYSNNRTIPINMSQNGSSITLNVWLVNSSSTAQTFQAMTVNVLRNDFVDEN